MRMGGRAGVVKNKTGKHSSTAECFNGATQRPTQNSACTCARLLCLWAEGLGDKIAGSWQREEAASHSARGLQAVAASLQPKSYLQILKGGRVPAPLHFHLPTKCRHRIA